MKRFILFAVCLFIGFSVCKAQFRVLVAFFAASNDTITVGDSIGGNLNSIGSYNLIVSGSVLYGIYDHGSSADVGSIYSVKTDGSDFKIIHTFNVGQGPNGLILSGTTFYGVCDYGGSNNMGYVFSMNTDGSNFQTLLNFNGTNGMNPFGNSPILVSGNMIYGITVQGGANYPSITYGTIFSLKTDGSGYKDIYDAGSSTYSAYNINVAVGDTLYCDNFSIHTDGSGFRPRTTPENLANLSLVSGDTAYGIIYNNDNSDSLFSVRTNGGSYKSLFWFGSDDVMANSNLTVAGNVLYGTTEQGGTNGLGNLYSISTDGRRYKDLVDFNDSQNGSSPNGGVQYSGGVLYGVTSSGGPGDGGVLFGFNTDTVSSAGIATVSKSSTFLTVYPNPAKDNFIIESSASEVQTLTVSDITGKLMMTQSIQNDKVQVDSGDLAEGVYNVCLTGATGRMNKRLVIIR